MRFPSCPSPSPGNRDRPTCRPASASPQSTSSTSRISTGPLCTNCWNSSIRSAAPWSSSSLPPKAKFPCWNICQNICVRLSIQLRRLGREGPHRHPAGQRVAHGQVAQQRDGIGGDVLQHVAVLGEEGPAPLLRGEIAVAPAQLDIPDAVGPGASGLPVFGSGTSAASCFRSVTGTKRSAALPS